MLSMELGSSSALRLYALGAIARAGWTSFFAGFSANLHRGAGIDERIVGAFKPELHLAHLYPSHGPAAGACGARAPPVAIAPHRTRWERHGR